MSDDRTSDHDASFPALDRIETEAFTRLATLLDARTASITTSAASAASTDHEADVVVFSSKPPHRRRGLVAAAAVLVMLVGAGALVWATRTHDPKPVDRTPATTTPTLLPTKPVDVSDLYRRLGDDESQAVSTVAGNGPLGGGWLVGFTRRETDHLVVYPDVVRYDASGTPVLRAVLPESIRAAGAVDDGAGLAVIGLHCSADGSPDPCPTGELRGWRIDLAGAVSEFALPSAARLVRGFGLVLAIDLLGDGSLVLTRSGSGQRSGVWLSSDHGSSWREADPPSGDVEVVGGRVVDVVLGDDRYEARVLDTAARTWGPQRASARVELMVDGKGFGAGSLVTEDRLVGIVWRPDGVASGRVFDPATEMWTSVALPTGADFGRQGTGAVVYLVDGPTTYAFDPTTLRTTPVEMPELASYVVLGPDRVLALDRDGKGGIRPHVVDLPTG